ncbi:MAG: SUMF1/EgtB/PvdO family nonheme iron enzyme [Pirellulales bacterium]|nr:SUMF1/EgtB/PvdO family nonheme iron enzyme [Pirellulales bacterium]
MLLAAGQVVGDPDERFDTRADLRRSAPPQAVVARLLDLYQNDPDPGIHAAAEWTLRRYGQSDEIVRFGRQLASSRSAGDCQWYVNSQGHTLVVVPGPAQFLMGSAARQGANGDERPHYQRIRRSFSIASTETSVEQFRRFLDDHPRFRREPGTQAGASQELPQTSVTWYEAAAYCNWLSESDHLPEDQWCYAPNDMGEYAAGMTTAVNYQDLRGYRLPTEAEWEYACRAGATTRYAFGDDNRYLPHYAVFAGGPAGQPDSVARRMPNDFGLFDMHGNLAEWCQDRYVSYPAVPNGLSIDASEEPARDADCRVLRGGTFHDSANRLRCAARDKEHPGQRRGSLGFRVARSYP